MSIGPAISEKGMNMKASIKWWWASALLLGLVFSGWAHGAELPPDEQAKRTVDEVLAIIKQDKELQTNNRKLLALVEAKILPQFDFTQMTRLAVGKNWRAATPEQQEALVREFRTMLVRTYSSSLANFKNQTIEFKPLRMDPNATDVLVRTLVLQPGGHPIPIDYSMQKASDGWKVYDVSVDGVSLVTTYRSSFANEVRQGGIDGLIRALSDKNRSASSAR